MIIIKAGDINHNMKQDAYYLHNGELKKIIKLDIYWDRVIIKVDGNNNNIVIDNDDYLHLKQ